MKQIISTLALGVLAGFANEVYAQAAYGNKHKVLINVGTGVGNGDLNNSEFRYRYNMRPNLKPVANINVSVKYFISNRLALGVAAGFYHYTGYSEGNRVATPNLLPTAVDYQVEYFSRDYLRHTEYIAAEAAYTYLQLNRSCISFYSSGGFGITHTTGYVNDHSNAVYVNWPPYGTCGFDFDKGTIDENKLIAYVAPIGICGGKKLSWYAELGYGYKGILNAGIGYKL